MLHSFLQGQKFCNFGMIYKCVWGLGGVIFSGAEIFIECNFLGSKFLGGSFHRGSFHKGIFIGGNFLVANFLRVIFWGGRGGQFSEGQFS